MYSRTTWVDSPSTSTPVDAANLNNLETGIVAASVNSIPFSVAGSAATGTSGAWTAPVAGTATKVRLSCVGAPSGSDLVAAFQKNGTTFSTLTITAGTTTAQSATTTQTFSAGDTFAVDLTSVGSGTAATGVTAQVDYSS